MGVTFRAYTNATLVNNPTEEQMENGVYIIKSDSKYRLGSIVDDSIHTADCEQSFGTSCGGFNDWREQLAELANYTPIYIDAPKEEPNNFRSWQQNCDLIALSIQYKRPYSNGAREATGGDFWELLDSPDNEGAIGPEVCKKLVKDFKRYENKASKHACNRFKELYNMFHELFEIASKNGFVNLS